MQLLARPRAEYGNRGGRHLSQSSLEVWRDDLAKDRFERQGWGLGFDVRLGSFQAWISM